ncbi:MAG: hypothetical protein INQ03_22140 [Candidatus Heimdallarchaeota archaeon]|nr:hypothetical protein [Candidatus Heimdallarchaeota archaeon]
MNLSETLDNWFDNGDLNLNTLVKALNLSSVIWLTIHNGEIHLKDKCKGISDETLDLLAQYPDFSKIKGSGTLKIGDQSFKVINSFFVDGDKHIIISEDMLFDYNEVKFVLSTGIRVIILSDMRNFLQDSVNLVYSDPQSLSEMSLSKIPPAFVDAVIPVATYSVVNESFGPHFISTCPVEFNSYNNMLFVVNIYSTLNSEQIARHGQVINSTPTSIPEDGETLSIVFTIPNDDARGGFEIHGLSVVITQNFLNISKGLLIQMKSIMFSVVEQIRQLTFMNNWCLIKDEIAAEPVQVMIEPLLKGMRMQLSALFAVEIGQNEVNKWTR